MIVQYFCLEGTAMEVSDSELREMRRAIKFCCRLGKIKDFFRCHHRFGEAFIDRTPRPESTGRIDTGQSCKKIEE